MLLVQTLLRWISVPLIQIAAEVKIGSGGVGKLTRRRRHDFLLRETISIHVDIIDIFGQNIDVYRYKKINICHHYRLFIFEIQEFKIVSKHMVRLGINKLAVGKVT